MFAACWIVEKTPGLHRSGAESDDDGFDGHEYAVSKRAPLYRRSHDEIMSQSIKDTVLNAFAVIKQPVDPNKRP